MNYQVDRILNNWFGETPENSDNEDERIKHLYEPLREMERELERLRWQLREQD